jgi:hypothetical protein
VRRSGGIVNDRTPQLRTQLAAGPDLLGRERSPSWTLLSVGYGLPLRLTGRPFMPRGIPKRPQRRSGPRWPGPHFRRRYVYRAQIANRAGGLRVASPPRGLPQSETFRCFFSLNETSIFRALNGIVILSEASAGTSLAGSVAAAFREVFRGIVLIGEETFDPQNISIVSKLVHTAGAGSHSINVALRKDAPAVRPDPGPPAHTAPKPGVPPCVIFLRGIRLFF